MKHRVQEKVREAKDCCILTFHALCVTILRDYGNLVGIEHNFTIADGKMRTQMIKNCLEELEIKQNAKVQN